MRAPRKPRRKEIPATQQKQIWAMHREGFDPVEIVRRLHDLTGVRRRPATISKVIEIRREMVAREERKAKIKARLKALFYDGSQPRYVIEVIRREFNHHLSEDGVRSAWWDMGLRRPAMHRDRWRGRLAVPAHAHPMVRTLFRSMNKQATSISDISERSGIPRGTISKWARTMPRIDLLEAALNVLDLEMVIRERHPE